MPWPVTPALVDEPLRNVLHPPDASEARSGSAGIRPRTAAELFALAKTACSRRPLRASYSCRVLAATRWSSNEPASALAAQMGTRLRLMPCRLRRAGPLYSRTTCRLNLIAYLRCVAIGE